MESSSWNDGQDCPMVKINRILVKFHVILLKIHRKNVVNLEQDLVILGQDLVDLGQASWSRYKILDHGNQDLGQDSYHSFVPSLSFDSFEKIYLDGNPPIKKILITMVKNLCILTKIYKILTKIPKIFSLGYGTYGRAGISV